MAKVILDTGDTFTLANAATVVGGVGTEKLLLTSAATGAVIGGDIERVELSGNLSTYTFAVSGNVVTVRSGTTVIATISVPDNATGQTLAFADGSAALKLTGTAFTLGGVAVPATAAAVVATLNTADKSTVAAPGGGNGGTTIGQIITLTNGIDVKTGTDGGDTFDGSVNTNGTATLTSVDVLDGGLGTDNLIAELTGAQVIAPTVSNVETIELISSGTALNTFNLINVANAPTVVVRNSSRDLTLDSFTGSAVTLRDQSADLNINQTNSVGVGANTFTVNLTGAQKGAATGATIALTQMSGTDTTGIETVSVVSGGNNSNFLTALTSTNGGTSKVTAVNVSGAQALTINSALNTTVKSLNASANTGGVTASLASTTTATVTGGTGNDSFTLTASAGDVSVTAGAGNDVVSFTGGSFTSADTVAGGDGAADRLDLLAADAEGVSSALANTTGFEQISLNNAGSASASLNATRFGTIDTVRLDGGTAGAYGVTFAAGTMNLGFATAAQTLGGTLTVTDTGTASTDAIIITNRNTTSATDNFNSQNVVSAGFETVTFNSGSTATAAQVIGTVTITGDSTTTAQTVNFAGANKITVGAISSNSSGLLTVDASAMTAQATGTTFVMSAPIFAGALGTVKITGSAGSDTLVGHTSVANTIDGGAGNDAITGGSAADSLVGGAGNDAIVAAGGNDTVSGGDGNDSINISAVAGTVSVDAGAGTDSVNAGALLSAGDTIVGGDGTDTITISTAVAASVAGGVSGFETLAIDGNVAQDLVQFTGNTGFTRLNFGTTAANTISVTNVGTAIATLGLADVDLTSGTITRLVNTATDTLAITAAGNTATRTVGTLSIANEDTVSIATGSVAAGNLTITTLTADAIKSLTVTGAGNLVVTNAIANAASLATINAVAATGTVTLDASTSVVDMTVTGSLAAANTITGGTGADTMLGGDVADSLTGGNGADSITGGGGADSLQGGIGNDTIVGGLGADSITGGTGNDMLTGGDAVDTFVFAGVGLNGVDTITDFVTTVDKIDVTTSIVTAAVVQTAAAAQAAITTTTEYYLSTNGAAANLTTGGTATLNVADLTASTLTNLAAYLTERFSEGTAADVAVLAINWTAGGNTTTYVYEFVEDATGTAVIASELTLTGIVTHAAGAILVNGDLI